MCSSFLDDVLGELWRSHATQLAKAFDDSKLQTPLSDEAASQYRRALGKLSWYATTRGDLVYFVSMLARGQSSPCEYHERGLRATLRYLKTAGNFFQVFPRQKSTLMQAGVQSGL